MHSCSKLETIYFNGTETQWNTITKKTDWDLNAGRDTEKGTYTIVFLGEETCEHEYEAVVTAPTCTEGGYTTYTCSECGDSYVADETAALGHTEVEDAAVAPTCTETGLTAGKHCEVCGEITVEQTVVDALGHDYVDGVCSRCETVDSEYYTEGLVFTLNDEGTEYSVTDYTGTATEVVIPAIYEGLPVTSIGEKAFETHRELTSVTIPNGVTIIGDYAFYYCDGLTSITIPNSVTVIAERAFSSCHGLTSITFEENSQLTSIGTAAFEACRGLTSITIPNSVTSIETWAFSWCEGLTNITIPNSVTSIDDGAFPSCLGLENIVVEEGNTVYHSIGNCVIETSTKTLIIGCKNSIIPSDNSVTSIGNYAFYNHSGLTSLTIPNSITSIGYHAFSGCDALTSITIPNSVTSIGNYAFHWCEGLTSITFVENSQFTSIGDYAFSNCFALTSVEIPDSVTKICQYAFAGCASLTSIEIPDSVTEIHKYAFSNCEVLTSVVFGENSQLTSIGDRAFLHCEALTSIKIPSGVTSIGFGAFQNCIHLVSVEFEENSQLTRIEQMTFCDCIRLKSIEIPDTVTYFGYSSFDYCYLLETIYFFGTEIQWNAIEKGSCWDSRAGVDTAKGTYTVVFLGNENCEHNYEAVVTAPTCIEGGYTTYTCSICGDSYVGDETLALGHTEGEPVEENRIEATCTEDGSYDLVIFCTVCDEEISRETVVIEAPGHTPGDAASCTTAQRCTVCGEILVDALGHTEGEVVVENEVAAGCTTSGSYDNVVYCIICEEELSRETITVDALGHTLTEVEAKAATCTEIGWNAYEYCLVCDYTTYEEIPATGHTEVDDAAVAPTCTETGLTEGKRCTVCGEITVVQTVIEATGHTEGEPEEENRIEATCTEEGSYDLVIFCTVCDEEISRETVVIEALGHTELVQKEAAIDATCSTTGKTEVRGCERCDYTEGGYVIPVKPHVETVIPGTPATCKTTGLTDGKKCSICGTIILSQTVISKLPHSETTVPGTSATCTTSGLTSGKKCSVCGTVTVAQSPIPAIGHNVSKWTEDGEMHSGNCSVCTAKVTEAHKYVNSVCKCGATTEHEHEIETWKRYNKNFHFGRCKVCNKNIHEDHIWEEISREDPTCETAGSILYRCTECGAENTEPIKKRDHKWDEGKITKEPTCKKKGERNFECEYCNKTKSENIDVLDHSYRTATNINDGEHVFRCTECKYEHKSKHNFEIIDGVNKCRECGAKPENKLDLGGIGQKHDFLGEATKDAPKLENEFEKDKYKEVANVNPDGSVGDEGFFFKGENFNIGHFKIYLTYDENTIYLAVEIDDNAFTEKEAVTFNIGTAKGSAKIRLDAKKKLHDERSIVREGKHNVFTYNNENGGKTVIYAVEIDIAALGELVGTMSTEDGSITDQILLAVENEDYQSAEDETEEAQTITYGVVAEEEVLDSDGNVIVEANEVVGQTFSLTTKEASSIVIDGENNSADVNITGTYTQIEAADVISVTISWDNTPTFTYSVEFEWDDEEFVEKPVEGSGKWSETPMVLTATNHSNQDISASFTYTATGNDTTGKFSSDALGDTELTENKVTLESAETGHVETSEIVYFFITGGTLTEEHKDGINIGNITITIAGLGND